MLDDQFLLVSRSAIIVKPKEPFMYWVKNLPRDSKEESDPFEEEELGDVFLIPSYDTRDEIEKWLSRNAREIFEEELFKWWTDESIWPPKRTFKVFKDWFSYSVNTMIFDTQKDFIEKI